MEEEPAIGTDNAESVNIVMEEYRSLRQDILGLLTFPWVGERRFTGGVAGRGRRG